MSIMGFPVAQWEIISLQCRRHGFHQSLAWEDSPEKEMGTHLNILSGKSHGQKRLLGYSPWGCQRVGHYWAHTHTRTHAHYQWLEKGQVVPAPEKGCYGNHVGFEDLSQKGSSTLYIFTLNKKLACTFILKDVVWPYKPGTGSERCRMFKCSFFYC